MMATAEKIYEHYFSYIGDRRFMIAKKREIDAWLDEGCYGGDFKSMTLDDLVLEWGKVGSQTWSELAVQVTVLLTALEALVTEPSDDWRDATDDDDGHTRTPHQRALKQARAAIAKAKELSSYD